MNYGFASLDPSAEELPDAQPGADRFGLQLYAAVAGAAELTGKTCSRWAAAEAVAPRSCSNASPRSMTGLDLARQAIERCRAR